MKTLIPFLAVLLNLNLFFASAVTGQDIAETIKAGDLAAIQGFIDAGENFNQTFGHSTPLSYAIEYDRIEIARAILAAPGIDINFPSRFGLIPIYCAARNGKDEMIRLLLADERCARNQAGPSGMTPLHAAAFFGKTSSVQTFLEDPTVNRNIVGGSGSTALDYVRDRTALDAAIFYNHFDTAVVLLNDPHVVKNRIDRNGLTILHKIVQFQDDHDELRRVNKLRILDAILGVGVIDVDHRDLEGKTALHYAVESDDPEVILKLTAAGADPAIEDESGHNAIHYALIREPALEQNYLDALYAVFGRSLVGLK